MQGLGQELRRLGFKSSSVNRKMAKAIEEGREAKDDNISDEIIVSIRKITLTTEQEKAFEEGMALIAIYYRKGFITEDQARELAAKL